jgi:hypothetical protein
MMRASGDGAERLAEIFREILALSGPKQPNHSKSTGADDPIKSFDTQSASEIHQTCAPRGKHASEKGSEPEDQGCRRKQHRVVR